MQMLQEETRQLNQNNVTFKFYQKDKYGEIWLIAIPQTELVKSLKGLNKLGYEFSYDSRKYAFYEITEEKMLKRQKSKKLFK